MASKDKILLESVAAALREFSTEVDERIAEAKETLSSSLRETAGASDSRSAEIGAKVDGITKLIDSLSAAQSEIAQKIKDIQLRVTGFSGDVDALDDDYRGIAGKLEELSRAIGDDLQAHAEQLDHLCDFEKLVGAEIDARETSAAESNEAIEKKIADIHASLDAFSKKVSDSFRDTGHSINDAIQDVVNKIEETGSGLSRRIASVDDSAKAAVDGLSASVDAAIGALAEDDRKALTEISDLRDGLVKKYQDVDAWMRGGPEYAKHALVSHRGGIWYAAENTSHEPGETDVWRLIQNGIAQTSIRQVDADVPTLELELEFTNGDRISGQWQQSSYRDTGTHQKATEYSPGDLFRKDGNSYLVLHAGVIEDPNQSESCCLLAMRGARGARGANGKQGPAGPPIPLATVRQMLMEELDPGIGIPVRLYRGAFVPSETYSRGDFVTIGSGLYISSKDDNDQLPGEALQDSWSPMVVGSAGGGGGGGGTTLHADLTDTDTDGHPGSVITVPGGIPGNAVTVSPAGVLQDGGTPPGGSGTTNLTNTPSSDDVTVHSSSGTDTSIAAATAGAAGVMSGPQATQLANTDAAGTPRPPTAHDATHDAHNDARYDASGAASGVQTNLDTHKASGDHDARYDAVGSAGAVQANLDAHEADLVNPHQVTAAQAGADPAGSAAAVQSGLDAHEADLANPHQVDAAQAGADPAGSAAAVQSNLDDHEGAASPHSGHLIEVQAGLNVTVDNTDPQRPVVASSGGGGGSGLHADLTDTETDGHPGAAINIPGGVTGNAVAIAADGSLLDSGVPPGGAGGTTDLTNTPSATEVTVHSSSGQDTSIAAAGVNAGVMSAADKAALDATDAAGTARPPTPHDSDHDTHNDGRYDPLGSASTVQSALDSHEADLANPHQVTAAQVGADTSGSAAAVQTNLDSHEADLANPHQVTAAQANADPAGSAAAVQTNLDSHEADLANPHQVDAAQAGADPAGSAAAVQANLETHKTSADHDGRYYTETEVDALLADKEPVGALRAVEDDTAPVLGGNLVIGGPNEWELRCHDTGGVWSGSIGINDQFPAVFLAWTPTGTFVETDGAVAAYPAKLELYGSTLAAKSLAHTDPAGYQELRVSPAGVMYGASPPASGWTESDTDAADVQITPLGTWVEISGLTITLPEDVADGDLIEATISLYLENATSRTGSISIGFGLDAAAPGASDGVVQQIGANLAGGIQVNVSSTTHGGLTAGQTMTVWVRRDTQSHTSFDPWVRGTTEPSQVIVSVPTQGGSGGWVNGTVITDWGLTQAAVTGGGAAWAWDTTGGHVAEITLTEDATITVDFGSQTNTEAKLVLNSGGFIPTFASTGNTIYRPSGGHDWTHNGRYVVSVTKTGTSIDVVEQPMEAAV